MNVATACHSLFLRNSQNFLCLSTWSNSYTTVLWPSVATASFVIAVPDFSVNLLSRWTGIKIVILKRI